MSCSIKTFQKLRSWLTIFFQVRQKDAATFSPLDGIIKCNVSINILQQHICSSLQARIKNILEFCSEISKHYWGSYTFPFKSISELGFLESRLTITWSNPNQTSQKSKAKIRDSWKSERAGFAQDSWRCCHPSCSACLYCTDAWAAHRWALEPPPFAAEHFKVK